MARFFKALVTGRPLEAGGRSFIFEPVSPLGGGWQGVLAVDDTVAASILAAADGVSEISAEQYDALKKKRNGVVTSPVSAPSAKLPPTIPPLAASVRVVEGRSPLPAGTDKPEEATIDPSRPSVVLRTTQEDPPFEPVLDPAPKKRKSKPKKEESP